MGVIYYCRNSKLKTQNWLVYSVKWTLSLSLSLSLSPNSVKLTDYKIKIYSVKLTLSLSLSCLIVLNLLIIK